MTDWATTTGKMVASKVREERKAVRGTGGNNKYIYHPDVKYEYEVDGKQYTGTRAVQTSTGGANFRRSVETFIKQHPKGADVQVYYNPANPAESFLEKGGGSIMRSETGLIALVVVAVLVVFLIGLTARLLLF
jgi:hypothetical protein